MKKAIIYARAATEAQGFEKKIELCRGYAKANEFEVIHVLRDIGSGLDNDRPTYAQMKDLVSETNGLAVISASVSDIHRNSEEAIEFVDFLESNGSSLHTVRDGVPSGNWRHTLMVARDLLK